MMVGTETLFGDMPSEGAVSVIDNEPASTQFPRASEQLRCTVPGFDGLGLRPEFPWVDRWRIAADIGDESTGNGAEV